METERFDRLAKSVSRFASRRTVVGGAVLGGMSAALGLAGRLPGAADEVTATKHKRRKVICHCATNDPSTCKTIKVNKKSRKKHLQHWCDYPGPCQPGVVGRCTPPVQGCTRDSDCPSSTPYCQNRTCVACRNHNGCPVGEMCQDGACVPGCTRDGDCPAGTPICLDQVCVACVRNGDCCAPQVCNSDNQCVVTCGTGSCDPTTEKCCTPSSGAPVCIPFDQCCTRLDGVTALNQCLPTTNAANQATGGVRPYVERVSGTANSVTLRFVRGTGVGNVGVQFFEYRIDGAMKTCGTPHAVVIGDWQFTGVALPANTSETTRTFNANQKVEVRLALGPENDFYFENTQSGWITFNVGA